MIISTRPITGLEARAGLVAFAAMLWTKAGLPVPSVIWNPHIETARINQRKNAVEIVAISERATIPGTVVRKLAGLIAHEFLHARLTTMTPQVKPYLFALWNGIEDARIERTAIAQGMLGNAAALFSALLADHLGDDIDWQATENFPFSLAIHCRAYPGLNCPLPFGLESVWTEARNRVNAAQSSADSLAIAEWVLEQIRHSEEQGEDQGKDQGDDQGAEQGEEQGEEQGDKQGAEQGEDQGDKQGDKQRGAGRTSVDAATPSDPEAPMKGSIAKVPISGQVTIEHDETAAGQGHVTASLRRTPRTVTDSIPAATKAALRRMLDNSGRSDLDAGRRTGTVDTRAIARAPFDPAIFARRRETAGIDSAIHLLIDISGSMAGHEIKEARNVASAIYRAGIEAQAAVAVTVFDSHPGPLVPFGMGRRGLERIAQIDVDGGTNLSRAVRFAVRSTLARSEARRILIVLTDAAVGEDDARETMDILAAAESLGIQTIGIGIGANVGHAFTRHFRVDCISDLGPQVFAELSRTIRRAA